MTKLQISPGRRAFVRTVAITAPAILGTAAAVIKTSPDAASAEAADYRPKYFTPDEWKSLSALVDRLIPADSEGPGAIEAGVPEFIDQQMNTPYGHGHLWYMQGPFLPDAGAEFGYQQPHPPRDLYRLSLKDLEAAVMREHGRATASLDASQRDALLTRLEQNKLVLAGAPSSVFFGQLLQNTYEGYFCDPVHGGNRDMAAWQMVGFPGARADYMDWVRQYGAKYPLPPISRR